MILLWSYESCNFVTTEPILKVRYAFESYGPESFESGIYDVGVTHHRIGILGNVGENFAKIHGA